MIEVTREQAKTVRKLLRQWLEAETEASRTLRDALKLMPDGVVFYELEDLHGLHDGVAPVRTYERADDGRAIKRGSGVILESLRR